jgi:hypothetical protein
MSRLGGASDAEHARADAATGLVLGLCAGSREVASDGSFARSRTVPTLTPLRATRARFVVRVEALPGIHEPRLRRPVVPAAAAALRIEGHRQQHDRRSEQRHDARHRDDEETQQHPPDAGPLEGSDVHGADACGDLADREASGRGGSTARE